MSEQLLEIFRLGLLAMLYLFFVWVLWAVGTELRNPATAGGRMRRAKATPAPAPATRGRRAGSRGGSRLVIVEPQEQRGLTYDLESEMTMGRAPGCTIVVDDAFVSQVHTRIFESGGSYYLEDLGSTNGTYHNDNRVDGAVVLHSGDLVKVGDTILEYA